MLFGAIEASEYFFCCCLLVGVKNYNLWRGGGNRHDVRALKSYADVLESNFHDSMITW